MLDIADFAPLARGIPDMIRDPVPIPGITPACAGNTAHQKAPSHTCQKYPRLRGEYTLRRFSSACFQELPPLVRGTRDRLVNIVNVVGITPACAGNTRR